MDSFELIMSQMVLDMATFSCSPRLPIDTTSHFAQGERSPPNPIIKSGTTQIHMYCEGYKQKVKVGYVFLTSQDTH